MRCPCTRGCPDRTALCKKNCPKWKEFEEWKFQKYAQNEVTYKAFVELSPAGERALKRSVRK